MTSDVDPFSLPMAPTFNGLKHGEGGRFVVGNRDLREQLEIPRHERVLEIACGGSPVAAVFPRGPQHRWRLRLLDSDEPVHPPAGGWPRETTSSMEIAVEMGTGEPHDDHGPYTAEAPFKCVCGRLHSLDRSAVLEAAVRLEPRSRSARARRIDFRTVARVVRDVDA